MTLILCHQAKQHFGTDNCLVRFQALLSSLFSPPAFTTLRLNTRVNNADVLCAQVAELLREVRSSKSVVLFSFVHIVIYIFISHEAAKHTTTAKKLKSYQLMNTKKLKKTIS